MATLTVAGVEDYLSDYKSVGGSFIKELNLVLPRLYGMGMWKDLLYETTLSTTDHNFTLPSGEAIVSVMIDDAPSKIRTQFHDYRITGRNTDGSTIGAYGIIDDGLVPIKNELESDKTYNIKAEPISPDTTLPTSTYSPITITGLNNATTPVTKTETLAMDGSSSSTSSIIYTTITEIRTGDLDLDTPVSIIAVNSADSSDTLNLAEVQEANHISKFRRYRLSNSLGTTKDLRVLVKRSFNKLLNDTDPVYPSNLNAIKHAFLGSIAEDNADVERANYHWGVCLQLLQDELDSYRGSAKPVINLDPSGSGTRIPNIY